MKELNVEKMEKHQKIQDKIISKIEELFINAQEMLLNNEPVTILMDEKAQRHANQRSVERAVSRMQILSVIKDGFIIEASEKGQAVFDLLVFSNVKIGEGKYRPLHVAIIYNEAETEIIVKTVYDPRSMEEKWTNNYTQRAFYK